MNYHNITYPDMNNGNGLRVVLWLSGCSHHCHNCQNPQTWDANSGIPFDDMAKEELFRELNKDYISGLTLTGGDPLFDQNLDEVLDLVNQIRLSYRHKNIWLYTGYNIEDIGFGKVMNDFFKGEKCFNKAVDEEYKNVIRQTIVRLCDVVVDGRYIDSQRDITLKWRGSSNQRVINIPESLKQGKVITLV